MTGENVVEIQLNSTYAQPIDEALYQGETQMLTIMQALTHAECEAVPPAHGIVPVVFAVYDGQSFVHTPRFKLSDNTLSSPLIDGGGAIVATTTGASSDQTARCANVARTYLNEDSCFLSSDNVTCAVEEAQSKLVCGSPNEVSNELTLGGTQLNGAFDAKTSWGGKSSGFTFRTSKQEVWTSAVLSAQDQLRQKVAWVLSQVLVINTAETGRDYTEQYLNYFDIFVKHAFGNFRDVLKEVSYSPLMAEFLSYHGSKSTAYHWDDKKIVLFPDEVRECFLFACCLPSSPASQCRLVRTSELCS